MNTDIKIPNKILANRNQQHTKRITKWDLFLESKDDSIYQKKKKKFNVIHHNKMKRKNPPCNQFN